jgi:hypothetical protein
MNEKYWKEFYKGDKAPKDPSSFALFCLDYIPEKCVLWDIGCGNGRDTDFFIKERKKSAILGIDLCAPQGFNFLTRNIKNLTEREFTKANVIYSRFFLHSIDNFEIQDLLSKIKERSFFMAEMRAEGDKPLLFKDHKRNYIDGNLLLKYLIKLDFEILYFTKDRGLAKYKNEDPLVIRVIAIKK